MSLCQYTSLYMLKNSISRIHRASRFPALTQCRALHASASLRHGDTTISTPENGGDRLSGTWYIPDPANIDYRTVLAQLPQLHPTRRQRLTSALFLVTPKLAQWFDGAHPFHQDAINRIYQPILSRSPLESIVAVVDALPTPKVGSEPGQTIKFPLPSREGIALCLLSDRLFSVPSTEAQFEQSLIRFHSAPGKLEGRPGSIVSATLPTANTLFVNGMASTMFKQEWITDEKAESNLWSPGNARVYLSSLNIPIPRTPGNLAKYQLPMRPTTPARGIVTSMGNVLREVQGDDGASLRASTELEQNVPQYIKKKEAEGTIGSVKVFALIMPPASVSVTDDQHAEVDINQDKKVDSEASTGLGAASEDDISGTSVRNALNAGGRIVRVTGGGGGWGKKQGLLSLDDKVNFSTDEPPESSMFPSFEDELQDGPDVTPHELLPAGHTVQFFAAWVGPQEPDHITRSRLRESPAADFTARQWSESHKHKWILGTTLMSEEELAQGDDKIEKCTDLYSFDRHFGMLSHRGICLAREVLRQDVEADSTSSPDYNVIHQFRIDVPHTILQTYWSDRHPSGEATAPHDQERPESNQAKSPTTSSNGIQTGTGASPVESIIRKQAIQRKDVHGRRIKAQKHLRTMILEELEPDHAYPANRVQGYEGLDGNIRIYAPPEVNSIDSKQTARRYATRDSIVRGVPRQPPSSAAGSRKTEDHQNSAAQKHFLPFAGAKPANSESADGIDTRKLDPRISLYDAPNKVSWDRPRANVKPGQSV